MKETEGHSLGHSALGFSNSFSCCHNWNICDYGKKGCLFEQMDPLAMRACRCYQRSLKENAKEVSSPIIERIEETKVIENPMQFTNSEQMSLF